MEKSISLCGVEFKLKILMKIWYFLVFLLLIGLLVHENVKNIDNSRDGFSLKNYYENPQKYGDVKFERMGKITKINQDHFYFDLGNVNIKIFGSGVKKSILGETVVYVIYRMYVLIQLIDYHNYNFNYLLYVISIVALFVFIIIFFKEWKITVRGFEDA